MSPGAFLFNGEHSCEDLGPNQERSPQDPNHCQVSGTILVYKEIGLEVTELRAKTHTPIFGRESYFRPKIAHKMRKFQYFSI